jgi:phosphatidylinositol glycan class P protein
MTDDGPTDSAQASIRVATSGFVVWALTWCGLLIFLVWSGPGMRGIGLSYYPDRYWAVAAPALFVIAFYYYWTTYVLMYFRNTKPLSDLNTLTDMDAKGSTTNLGSLSDVNSSIPPISDLPINVTSRAMYEAWVE